MDGFRSIWINACLVVYILSVVGAGLLLWLERKAPKRNPMTGYVVAACFTMGMMALVGLLWGVTGVDEPWARPSGSA